MDEELNFATDSKFKQFGTAVDKALKSFEYSSEWADLISCLGKLNKVISTYSSFPVIPRKLLVGKRLAQCLHPALPSGVHLKALETYQLIFKQIGKARLVKDLFVYSSGLFPLLAQAAISVKPVLLDLYEEFYVPLGTHLIPGLPGFILAVLPGIEEGSEHNERTTSILETVCQNSQKESFYSALWGCVLHSTQVRLPAITFVLNHLGKQTNSKDTQYVFGNDHALMVDSVCAALDDHNVLVQRITLDLLLAFIPLSSEFIEQSEIIKILVCALNVVLRRDMSLNRRLYQWILSTGTESLSTESSRKNSESSNPSLLDESSVISLSYFEKFTKKYVVEAVIVLFKLMSKKEASIRSIKFYQTGKKFDKLRPFRILISLLDKPEIGSPVLEEVLVEVFRALYHECVTAKDPRNANDELLKTANLLFNAFEPYFIWEFLERALINSFIVDKRDSGMLLEDVHKKDERSKPIVVESMQPNCSELFALADFLLDVVHLDASNATQSEHWPSLLICLVTEMSDYIKTMKIDEIYQGVLLALKLLSKISPDIKSPFASKRKRSQSNKSNSRPARRKQNQETENSDASPILNGNVQSDGPIQGKKFLSVSRESHDMQVCVTRSTAFFDAFVKQRVVPWLHVVCHEVEEHDDENSSSECYTETASSSIENIDIDGTNAEEETGVPAETTCTLTFAAACRYLVELACFPCWESSAERDENTYDAKTLSCWLQSLISCASQTKNVNIQTVAMGTLLDLINVSLCVFPSFEKGHVTQGAANIIPLIAPRDFAILEKSVVYQDMASILWNQIQPQNCQIHAACADLFLRLHNISPSSLVCEDVISSSMVSHCLSQRRSAHWKFAVLWHLSREFYKNESSKSSRGGNRSLDRCMLLMLDSLQSDDPTISKWSQEWLRHSVHFGDIGRLIEPLLITMLNPSSRRISVHYSFLWKSSQLNGNTESASAEASTANFHWNGTDSRKQSFSNDSHGDQIDSVNDMSEEAFNEDIETRISGDDVSGTYSHDDADYNPMSTKKQTSENEAEQQQQLHAEERHENEPFDGKVIANGPARKKSNGKSPNKANLGQPVHPLHVHMLFYTQLYDTTQTIYALKTIMSVLETDGKAFVFASATTSMNMCNTAHQTALRELLIRHRRALSGKDFYGSLADSQQLLVKASTAKYMEILLSVCLYFIRSDFHNSMKVNVSDLEENFRVQVCSLSVLTKIVDVLLEVVEDGDVGFSNFVSDLFNRCKVQRIALHCLLSAVYNAPSEEEGKDGRPKSLMSSLVQDKSRTEMHRYLLQFIKKLIFLEERIDIAGVSLTQATNDKKSKKKERKNKSKPPRASPFEYNVEYPIVSQTMYLSVLLIALKEDKWCYCHGDWINMIIETLPKCGSSLAKIVIPIVEQICANFKSTAKVFYDSTTESTVKSYGEFPVDYMLTMLEKITSICHYCLVDKEISSVSQRSSTPKPSQELPRNENPLSIFESLAHVFSSQALPNRGIVNEEVNKPFADAREGLLSILPVIFSSILTVWHIWTKTECKSSRWKLATESPLPIGNPKSIKQAVLQFLTPLAVQHTPVFLAALADVWSSLKQSQQDTSVEKDDQANKQIKKEKKWLISVNQKTIPQITAEQQCLVDIVLAIKVLSPETVIVTSKQVIRQTLIGKEKGQSGSQSLELNLLQFLFEYIKQISNDQLLQIKPVLLTFLKEAINLNVPPSALFVLLNIFYVLILRIAVPDEKRARKELQDLALKFFEALNTIAGASLENSTWFRRNVAVLPQKDQSVDEPLVESADHSKDNTENAMPIPPTLQARNAQYSASALCLMAEVLSSMLDLLYLSEEKDKITSFLFYVMYNVTPYLKNHSNQNATSFKGSSALLSSITDYQYTLRSWKKDVYELFLDAEFFKMDLLSLQYWRSIIDRLMTYDVATFRDLMARINLTQSGTINIFANREQEMEQRASLLKRLTFVLFCGETDQYHNYMPDIQERLVDSLRQMQAPVLYEQVFFCFRILILRMSPHHLTSLWPPIITELILVFLHMEKELGSSESHQTKASLMGTLESFFTFNGVFKNKGKWLGLYLETCKLLDLSFSLQSDDVPHFQSYRWAFIDTPGVEYEAEELHKGDDIKKPNKDNAQEKVPSSVGKTSNHSQTKQEKSSSDSVSKLSVMNAPLSSKLRKPDKKIAKGKASAEKKHEDALKMKFAPYLSRLANLMVQKNAETIQIDWKSSHPLEMPKIESLFSLLPFLLSITGKRHLTEKTDFMTISSQRLEELIEKDFQDC